MSKAVLERESCPRAGDGVKRNGAGRCRAIGRSIGVRKIVHIVHDYCDVVAHHPIG